MKSSGALFVGIIQSQTVQDRLIEQFNLMHVYHDSKIEDARTDLAEHADVSEDRKSGIISIGVTDHDPRGVLISEYAKKGNWGGCGRRFC